MPWGILGILPIASAPVLGEVAASVFAGIACFSMLAYEGFNDWRKKDESYKDVLGICWGILIGGYGIWIFRLVGG